MRQRIRVLVVDDSALMRKHITSILSECEEMEVSTARDGLDALAQLQSLDPDVITLDINMPGLDGISVLSRIMAEHPKPVVMLSSLTSKGAAATLEALALGAVDFIEKPGGTVSHNIREIGHQIIAKVRSAALSKIGYRSALERRKREASTTSSSPKRRESFQSSEGLVLIGVSTGGPSALETILTELPENFPWPIVVAQHMPASFTCALAERLNKASAINICEVNKQLLLEPGTCYIGRGNADVVVSRRLGKTYVSTVPEDSHRWHPSVDRMVESAAKVYEARLLIGILLTGMGDDGAATMAAMHKAGARTIAESQESATVFGMPKELIERKGADIVLPIEDIAYQLVGMLSLKEARNNAKYGLS